MQRGIEREKEKARLSGELFVTLATREDYYYDGIDTSLELLESFSDRSLAVLHAVESAEKALENALADPNYGRPFHLTDSKVLAHSNDLPKKVLNASDSIAEKAKQFEHVGLTVPLSLRRGLEEEKKLKDKSIIVVFEKYFLVEDESGYDHGHFNFYVLKITSPDSIGPELFSFVNDESAWGAFLSKRGDMNWNTNMPGVDPK